MEKNWEFSGLQDLLLYDFWTPYQAWCILAGLDYRMLDKGEKLKALFISTDDITDFLFCTEEVDRLRDFWLISGIGERNLNPKFFIDWALTKRYKPKWLEWAIQENLYQPTEVVISSTTAVLPYETDLLKLLNLAVLEFFNPRKVSDAKKEEVTQWLKDKGAEINIVVSDNVADSIFTIIKPKNHNPKIKRVQSVD
jgi:hypothetical protein